MFLRWSALSSKATLGHGSISYVANAFAQRVMKSGPANLVPGGARYFVYGDGDDYQGRLLGEYDADNNAILEYVHVEGELHLLLGPSNRQFFVFTDHLGAPLEVWEDIPGWPDSVWCGNGMPYADNAPCDLSWNPNRITFNLRLPGQYFDAETGLHYNWHRYYDPLTGRYYQSDPIGLAGGINTFAYASNNPVGEIDPLGLMGRGSGAVAGRLPGTSNTANAQIGLNVQGHVGLIGVLFEGGTAIDTGGKRCGYIKFCGTLGPGLFFGAGGSFGGGFGDLSVGPQTTMGIVAVGALGPGAGVSIEGNSSGLGGSTSVRPQWKGGFGGMCGYQDCKTYFVCR